LVLSATSDARQTVGDFEKRSRCNAYSQVNSQLCRIRASPLIIRSEEQMSRFSWIISAIIAATLIPLVGALLMTRPLAANVLTVGSLYLIFLGSVLVFYQIKINLNYNKRKAATDLMFKEVMEILQPAERELCNILDKKHLIFDSEEDYLQYVERETIDDSEKKRVKELVKDILNFYERMAIGIFKGVYDEDICYDDKGLLMISFINWASSYIDSLQKNVEQRAYANAVDLAERWSNRYSEHTSEIKKAKRRHQQISTIDNKEIV